MLSKTSAYKSCECDAVMSVLGSIARVVCQMALTYRWRRRARASQPTRANARAELRGGLPNEQNMS
eukprot:1381324-Pyramimonas_sp.AAC.1